MKQMDDLLQKLELDTQLTLNDIPDLDLYMDQVIQLFENKYEKTKRNEEEKILTKTMINNYAKGKLFFPVKNKKYTKEHVMLIEMIYQMKSTLSINDVKQTMNRLNNKITDEDFPLTELYKTYITLNESNVERFKNDSKEIHAEIMEKNIEDADRDYISQLLLVATFTQMSNLFRRAAEKIVDEIEDSNQRTKKD